MTTKRIGVTVIQESAEDAEARKAKHAESTKVLLYLSFADDDGWRGCVLAEVDDGTDFVEVVRETWRRGCNPGGECLSFEVPDKVERDVFMDQAEREWFATKPRWTLITEHPPGAVKMCDVQLPEHSWPTN